MERTQVLELMSTLKLYGMRSAYDEVMDNGIKRQHEPPRIVGDLLQSEIAEKHAVRDFLAALRSMNVTPTAEIDGRSVEEWIAWAEEWLQRADPTAGGFVWRDNLDGKRDDQDEESGGRDLVKMAC
jgi:hypothetical protein